MLVGALLLLHGWQALPVQAQEDQQDGPLYLVVVEGVVTDVTVDYLRRALRQAEASEANALIIELSAEGAVLRALRPFASDLAAADVPVVVYVTPPETESGAAGAFLLSAAHIAAMAPDTSFGTPVPLADVDDILSTQTRDLVLDSVAQQLTEWNEERGRNTAWIEQAVRQGVIRTNNQAFATDPPAIDLTARDQEELLTLLQGRTVELADGSEARLETLGRTTRTITPNFWEQFLLLLASPTIAFLLLVMGGVAIYSELATPGIGIAAGIGTVLLLAALFGLIILPVRLLSLSGLVLAFVLIVSDLYVPTHGTLTVIGLVLLVISAMTLIDNAQAPNVFVAFWAILMVVVLVGAFVAVSVWLIVRTRDQPITTGQEGLVGRLAQARERLDPDGLVFVDGALWRAISDQHTIEAGEWVRIIAVHDLRLVVRALETESAGDESAAGGA